MRAHVGRAHRAAEGVQRGAQPPHADAQLVQVFGVRARERAGHVGDDLVEGLAQYGAPRGGDLGSGSCRYEPRTPWRC
jgi:hypothetical protein